MPRDVSGLMDYFADFNTRRKTRIEYERLKSEILKKPNDYDNTIFKMIDEVIIGQEDSSFRRTIEPGNVLYRARIIKPKDYPNPKTKNGVSVAFKNGKGETTGFNEMNSIESPLGISGEGRNNTKGMSYLYVAEDIETACAEMKSSTRELISLASFKVISPLSIIDFTQDVVFEKTHKGNDLSIGTLFSLLMSEFSVPKTSEDYLITQVISDYLRKTGIDGIAYRSFKTDKANYTIFNSHKNKIRFVGSKIILHYATTEVFWDFNEQSSLKAESDCPSEYDETVANNILVELERSFSKEI